MLHSRVRFIQGKSLTVSYSLLSPGFKLECDLFHMYILFCQVYTFVCVFGFFGLSGCKFVWCVVLGGAKSVNDLFV